MIEEAGGLSEEDRRWARSVLGLGDGDPKMTVVVLDAGAMIALERRDTRMLALADALYAARRIGYVPAGVVAQTWRGSARQHAMVRLLRAGAVRVDPVTV